MIYRFDVLVDESAKQLYPGAPITIIPHMSTAIELKENDVLMLTVKEKHPEGLIAKIIIDMGKNDSNSI